MASAYGHMHHGQAQAGDPEPELQDFDVVGSESSLSSFRLASALTWGIITLAVYLVVGRVRAWRRLSHIPGPFWAGVTDLWMIRTQWGGKACFVLKDVCDHYGPLARIGPNTVVCADGRELRRIWGPRSPFRRSYWWYRGLRLDPTEENILSERDEAKHAALRAKLTAGYSGKEVDGLHGLIDEQVLKFVGLIDGKYASDGEGKGGFRTMDLAAKAQYFTLDVLSSIAFGEPFGCLDVDDDVFGYIHITQATTPVLIMSTLLPPLLVLLQSPLFRPLLPRPEDVVGLGRVMGIAKEVVAQRFGEGKIEKSDMLGSFVAHGLSQEEAESEALVQIVAGSDTTATALRATLLHLMMTPDAYAKLRAEVDAAVRQGRASSPVVTDAEASALPYLQAAIREGLRIYPPIAGLMLKVSDKEDVICGQHVPAGTDVAWAPFAVMRNRAVFGEDAEVFRPGRWLEASPEQLREMELWQGLCFGSGGRWACLGKSVASIELNKAIFELFRRFDLSVARPGRPWTTYNAGSHIQKDFEVWVTRRKPLA